jgi:hypothetical protein
MGDCVSAPHGEGRLMAVGLVEEVDGVAMAREQAD